MRFKLALAAVLAATVAIAAAFATTSTASAAGTATTDLNAIPLSGTVGSTGGTFGGQLDVQRVAMQNGRLVAKGTVTGDVENAAGETVRTVTDAPVTVPIAADTTGSCQILDLSIGAVNLDVLGLVVHLDPVHLNITAQQGSGNLLGNLLCAVTHLLDNTGNGGGLGGGLGGLLAPIVNLLNQIIGRL